MDRVKQILESGLLESYLMGDCTEEQSLQMEKYIDAYPQVKKAYEDYQIAIENMADENAIEVPHAIKSQLMDRISQENPNPSTSSINTSGLLSGILALALLTAAFFWWNAKQELSRLQEDYALLKDKCEEKNQMFAVKAGQLKFIKDASTKTFVLTGESFGNNSEAVVFWNRNYNEALLQIRNLPALEKNQCYQIWADKNHKMISRGTFQSTQEFVEIDYLDNAESLNITIEPLGCSEEPTIERLVANVLFS